MDALIIQGSNTNPDVQFNQDGKLYLKGRAIPEDPKKMFQPLIDWIKQFEGNNIVLDINLEYMNTGASLVMFDLLKAINDKAGLTIKKVNWHYEEGDDDSFETGKMFDYQLENLSFEFFVEAEVF